MDITTGITSRLMDWLTILMLCCWVSPDSCNCSRLVWFVPTFPTSTGHTHKQTKTLCFAWRHLRPIICLWVLYNKNIQKWRICGSIQVRRLRSVVSKKMSLRMIDNQLGNFNCHSHLKWGPLCHLGFSPCSSCSTHWGKPHQWHSWILSWSQHDLLFLGSRCSRLTVEWWLCLI